MTIQVHVFMHAPIATISVTCAHSYASISEVRTIADKTSHAAGYLKVVVVILIASCLEVTVASR